VGLANGVRRVALIGLIAVVLAGCAQGDTASSESKAFYALLTADPLWQHHSAGFERSGDITDDIPRCTIVAHAMSEREAYAPQALYEGPLLEPWDAQLDEYLDVATSNGWHVITPPHDINLLPGGDQRREAEVAKEIDGHPVELNLGVLADNRGVLFYLDPYVPDINICPE
jgi:hypothetical protein